MAQNTPQAPIQTPTSSPTIEEHNVFRDSLEPKLDPQKSETETATSNPKIKVLDLSKMADEDPHKFIVDFGLPQDKPYDHLFEGQTKPVPETPNMGSGPNGQPFNNPTQAKVDFKVGVKVLIAIVDFGMSNLLKWFAKDKHANPYSADKESKKTLEEAILQILDENKVRIPTWLIVVLAFLSAYAFQFFAAFSARKKNSEDAVKMANLEQANLAYRQKIDKEKAERERQQQEIKKTGEDVLDSGLGNISNPTPSPISYAPIPTINTPEPPNYNLLDPGLNLSLTQDEINEGLFIKEGRRWRRYKKGTTYPCRYDARGREVFKGAPPKRTAKNS